MGLPAKSMVSSRNDTMTVRFGADGGDEGMSDRLGIGVMLSFLSDGNDSAEVIAAVIGKRIDALKMVHSESENDWRQIDRLSIAFTGGPTVEIYDNGQSCCEERYMQTDDDLTAFVGAEFRGVRIQDGPETRDEYGETHERFTVSNHNEHNGWYGGFAIVARLVDGEDQ